jgi:hypothetical protein
MRRIFRRYTQLTVRQKRLYSLLSVVTAVAALLYCLGIGGLVLRSRLVPEVALVSSPTPTATPTHAPTSVAQPATSVTPTPTLPPTPTQRPIPTFTPTPESVNITVVITNTDGLTSTVVISATVTPTPVLTPTVTVTAEVSLTLPAAETGLLTIDYPSHPSTPQGAEHYVLISPCWGHGMPGEVALLCPWGESLGPARALPGAHRT